MKHYPGLGPVFREIHGQAKISLLLLFLFLFLLLRLVRGKKTQDRDVVEGNIVNEIAPVGVCHHGLTCNIRLSDAQSDSEWKIVSKSDFRRKAGRSRGSF